MFEKITSSTVDYDGQPMVFPQLKTCGGYELMSSLANSQDVTVLKCSLAAHDIKRSTGGGQGKIYICPIQQSLSTKPVIEEKCSSLREKCKVCGNSSSSVT